MTIVTQAQGVGLQSPDEANEITVIFINSYEFII